MNTVKAGLVERVEDYPGFSSDLGLMSGGVMTVKRPPLYFDERPPEEVDIVFSTPPLLRRAYGSSREVVYQLRRARAAKERALADKRTFPVLGAARIRRQHPWDEPRSPRRLRKGPKPSFMVVGDVELERRCEREQIGFLGRYATARTASMVGEAAVFPHGTYAMRVLHGATVEGVESTADLVLSAPGKLEPTDAASRETRTAWNGALRADAAEVCDEELENTLAERIEESKADAVDRRDAGAPIPECVEDPPSKRVVRRGSTASARRRRRRIQQERAERARDVAGEGTPNAEHADPDPPPD